VDLSGLVGLVGASYDTIDKGLICAFVESVEPRGVQALKNPNPLKDVEALVVLGVAVLV